MAGVTVGLVALPLAMAFAIASGLSPPAPPALRCKLELVTRELDRLPPIVVIRLRNMTAIDATGLRALEQLAETLRASGRQLLLCGARSQPARLIHQAGFEAHVGSDNILPHVQAALERARVLYEAGVARSGAA